MQMFQFHKVQLKVDTGIAKATRLGWFQFHKVQLKESSVGFLFVGYVFQFHKVQLKAE